MEKMLVVVFENEKKAFEGTRALADLDLEGSIAVHAEAVIQKNQDGTVSMKQGEDDFPVRTVGGTAIGSLIGLLGGPVGFGIGAAIGATTATATTVNQYRNMRYGAQIAARHAQLRSWHVVHPATTECASLRSRPARSRGEGRAGG